MKTVYINQKKVELTGNATMATALERHIDTQTGGIAAALNDLVIPKEDWAKTYPSDGDRITILEAWQGG